MLNIVSVHDVDPPPMTGGIEKRIVAFIKFLKKNNIAHKFYHPDNIDKITHGNVLGFNLEDDVIKYFDYKKIPTINTYCGGFGPGEEPKKYIFTSHHVLARFPSEALRQCFLKKGMVSEFKSFALSLGMEDDEYATRTKKDRKTLMWLSSLGWGWSAKGLDNFVELAYNNPDYRFEVWGGRWNSESLECALLEQERQIDNLHVNFDLEDQNKHRIFDNTLALCQFSKLIESCNIVTLEAMTRGVPVITLPVANNGGVDENLGQFNWKLRGKFLDKSFEEYINSFDQQAYSERAAKFNCSKEYEELQKIYNQKTPF